MPLIDATAVAAKIALDAYTAALVRAKTDVTGNAQYDVAYWKSKVNHYAAINKARVPQPPIGE